ncbi:RseA family anti-sigma factor [Thalassotalea sp. Y01]|uniref:sigma-E factor negative regulatory protein n=1 Tax=Thalassotalea sp. Y01 TaxID=2729613 RepID=UPI00145E6444|nr:RseA family anti-sigma factor [Thalassotalea sp. Y01]NMP17677.1 hypothetical protein [Thalassotalea sp. Y01]
MSDNKFETVSSLLDEQSVDTDTLDQLKHDDRLAQTYGRYQLYGDIMRNESADFIDNELADDIAMAIAAEPTVLAPKKSSSLQQWAKAKVVQLAKPVGQMAIAASAAGLMVLGVQQANTSDDKPLTPTQVWQPLPIGGVADPVSYNYPQPSIGQQRQQAADHHKKLQSLLNDHQLQIKIQNSETAEQQQTVNPQGAGH